jgi:HEAT repeat protein
MTTSFEHINEELIQASAPTNYVHLGKVLTPLEAFVNGLSSEGYTDILLRHLRTADYNTKEFIARALTRKGNFKATQPLLDLFYLDPSMSEYQLWAVANALNVINDPSSYEALLAICKDSSYGIARQMLFERVAKLKTQEAYDVLISCLDDPSVKWHVIGALGKMGDKRAIPILERVVVRPKGTEARVKKIALKRVMA